VCVCVCVCEGVLRQGWCELLLQTLHSNITFEWLSENSRSDIVLPLLQTRALASVNSNSGATSAVLLRDEPRQCDSNDPREDSVGSSKAQPASPSLFANAWNTLSHSKRRFLAPAWPQPTAAPSAWADGCSNNLECTFVHTAYLNQYRRI
jgi:hypothetical protein